MRAWKTRAQMGRAEPVPGRRAEAGDGRRAGWPTWWAWSRRDGFGRRPQTRRRRRPSLGAPIEGQPGGRRVYRLAGPGRTGAPGGAQVTWIGASTVVPLPSRERRRRPRAPPASARSSAQAALRLLRSAVRVPRTSGCAMLLSAGLTTTTSSTTFACSVRPQRPPRMALLRRHKCISGWPTRVRLITVSIPVGSGQWQSGVLGSAPWQMAPLCSSTTSAGAPRADADRPREADARRQADTSELLVSALHWYHPVCCG